MDDDANRCGLDAVSEVEMTLMHLANHCNELSTQYRRCRSPEVSMQYRVFRNVLRRLQGLLQQFQVQNTTEPETKSCNNCEHFVSQSIHFGWCDRHNMLLHERSVCTDWSGLPIIDECIR